MSDIDDFASDASDQLDSDVDMESPSETLPAILPSSVGGKGLPVPITAQYFEGVNHDEDEDLDMPETDTIVDDDKVRIIISRVVFTFFDMFLSRLLLLIGFNRSTI